MLRKISISYKNKKMSLFFYFENKILRIGARDLIAGTKNIAHLNVLQAEGLVLI